MKINEIEYGHWNKPSIPETSKIDGTVIGTFDGLDIFTVSLNGLKYFLILNPDKTYQGYISVRPGFIFNEAYVTEKHRRRGVCTILILFVLRKLNKKLTIAPDEILTDDSRQLFYNLAQSNKIKIKVRNKLIDLLMLSKIFIDVDDNNIKLVIEGSLNKESATCNEIVNPATGFTTETFKIGNSVRKIHWYD